jgi:hypothetical protein
MPRQPAFEPGPAGQVVGSEPLSAKSIELVDGGDMDLLTSHVNGLVMACRWEELDALRHVCRLSSERGKQLWAVAAYIEYRLCLEAPGPWAARILEAAPGRFALGPLPEVAASRHTWDELAPHLHPTPQAAMVAHERALRGEDLTHDPLANSLPELLDLPLRREPWEPEYALAHYAIDKVESPEPPVPRPLSLPSARSPRSGRAGQGTRSLEPVHSRLGPDEVSTALEDLAAVWVTESNGRVESAPVEGLALDAIWALGAKPREMVKLDPETALAVMAWTAASGGAHGRRRGAAPGRFGAWAVLAALAEVPEGWAGNAGRLADAATSARWYAWGSGEPVTGWSLRLAVEAGPGPKQGRSYVVSAIDAY